MKKSALERLREMSREPVRSPMSRGVQYPSLAQQHLADEQEIQRLRVALGEAVSIIDELRHENARLAVADVELRQP